RGPRLRRSRTGHPLLAGDRVLLGGRVQPGTRRHALARRIAGAAADLRGGRRIGAAPGRAREPPALLAPPVGATRGGAQLGERGPPQPAPRRLPEPAGAAPDGSNRLDRAEGLWRHG